MFCLYIIIKHCKGHIQIPLLSWRIWVEVSASHQLVWLYLGCLMIIVLKLVKLFIVSEKQYVLLGLSTLWKMLTSASAARALRLQSDWLMSADWETQWKWKAASDEKLVRQRCTRLRQSDLLPAVLLCPNSFCYCRLKYLPETSK